MCQDRKLSLTCPPCLFLAAFPLQSTLWITAFCFSAECSVISPESHTSISFSRRQTISVETCRCYRAFLLSYSHHHILCPACSLNLNWEVSGYISHAQMCQDENVAKTLLLMSIHCANDSFLPFTSFKLHTYTHTQRSYALSFSAAHTHSPPWLLYYFSLGLAIHRLFVWDTHCVIFLSLILSCLSYSTWHFLTIAFL